MTILGDERSIGAQFEKHKRLTKREHEEPGISTLLVKRPMSPNITSQTIGMNSQSISDDIADNWVIDPSLLPPHGPTDPHPESHAATKIGGTVADNLRELELDLEMLTYDVRDQILDERLADTTTRRHYQNYVKEYVQWWDRYQFEVAQTPGQVTLPALPITPAKVVLFLDYTMKRPRRTGKGQDLPGTTVGKATIQSTINALEWERGRNAHLYPDNKSAQVNLRSDNRIKQIERAAKHNEPQRILLAQTLKASGTSADTYTQTQMVQISLSCFTRHHTLAAFSTDIRDRALYLVPLCTAFRGDNIRELAFSDLFSKPILNVKAGIEKQIMSLRILCNNAKHNQSGKTEEQGAIRHRLPELCCIGALALHFFMVFHKSGLTFNWKPDFSEDAQRDGYGQYGRREWWLYKVFPGGLEKTQAMTYKNHNGRIHHLHKTADTNVSKVTHAARYSAAFIMRAYGTGKEETRSVGWSTADSYNSVYDRELPLEALLGAAMYNARKPETHFAHVKCLVCLSQHPLALWNSSHYTTDPPVETTSLIFPWVEEELQALKDREASDPRARDFCLQNFLSLLIEMRRILVQDLAILYNQVPDSYIFTCLPFNLIPFRNFAVNAQVSLKEYEKAAELALQDLPAAIAQTFEGAMQQSASKQKLAQLELQRTLEDHKKLIGGVVEQLVDLKGLVGYSLTTEPSRKRRKLNPPAQPIRSMFTAPPIPSLLRCREDFIDEDSELACRNMEGTIALVPRPPSAIPPLCELPLAAGISLPSMPRSEQPLVATQFTVLPQLGHSSQHVLPEIWADNWKELLQLYNPNQLARHLWDWEGTQLVLHYDLQPVKTFEDVWKENVQGINGFLPLRILRERWGNSNPGWHRNDGAKKTPSSRRRKVTNFIEMLSLRPHWSAQRALKFIQTHCSNLTVDKLARTLKGEYLEKLLAIVEAESTPNV